MKKVIDRSKNYFWGMVVLFVLMLFTSGIIATFASEEELSPESVEFTSADAPPTGKDIPNPNCNEHLEYTLYYKDQALNKSSNHTIAYVGDTIRLDYNIKEGYEEKYIVHSVRRTSDVGNTKVDPVRGREEETFSESSGNLVIEIGLQKKISDPKGIVKCKLNPPFKVEYPKPSCDYLEGSFSPSSGKRGTEVSANFELKSDSPEWIKIEGYDWSKDYRSRYADTETTHTYNDAGRFIAAVKLINTKDTSGNTYQRCKETDISIQDDPTPNCSQLSYSFDKTSLNVGGNVKVDFSTDEDWISVRSIDWRDGSSREDNPSSPITHTYNALGNYKPSFVLINRNNSSKSITCSADNYQDSENKTITVSASCGNGRREDGEECDGEVGCSSSCSWKSVDCATLRTSINPQNGSLPLPVNALFNPETGIQLTKINRGSGPDQNIPDNTNQLSHIYSNPGTFTVTVYGKNIGNQREGECRIATPVQVNGMSPDCSNMGIKLKNESGFAPLATEITFAPHEDIKIETLSWGTGEIVRIGDEKTAKYTYNHIGHYPIIITASNKKNPDLRGECRLNDAVRVSSASCGDGKIEHLEQCDDKNTENGDGCSSACQLESIDCKKVNIQLSQNEGIIPFDTQLRFNVLTGFVLTNLNRGNQNNLTGNEENLITSPLVQKYDKEGNYNISLTFKTTIPHSSTTEVKISNCSINLTAKRKQSSGYSGGGGRSRDYCPNGDYSPSYYDGKCESEKKEEIIPKIDTCKVDRIKLPYYVDQRLPYSQELIDAYERAYGLKITTICPIQNADLEGGLRRRHMAKMISNFATKVFKVKPDLSKECNFSDIGDQSDEMKYYIKLSCQLGIMGYKADGKTQKIKFEPNIYVTRGQFITILSRLLRGEKYNNNKENHFYRDHLWALKRVEILDNFILNARAPELRGLALIMLHKGYKYQNNIAY